MYLHLDGLRGSTLQHCDLRVGGLLLASGFQKRCAVRLREQFARKPTERLPEALRGAQQHVPLQIAAVLVAFKWKSIENTVLITEDR